MQSMFNGLHHEPERIIPNRLLRLARSVELILFFLLLVSLASCGSTSEVVENLSTRENSASRPVLQDKVDFVGQYFSFEREYEALEYVWLHQDNSGGIIPGPSDWSYQLLAIVPAETVDDWTIEDVAAVEQAPPDWVQKVPGNIPTDGITEWYITNQKVVGVDRERSVIAYWLSSEIISD